MSALAVTIKAICAGLTVLILLVIAHPAMLALVLLALPALLITKAQHAHVATGSERAPEQIVDGIRLENVSFRYPGTEKWVLRNVADHPGRHRAGRRSGRRR